MAIGKYRDLDFEERKWEETLKFGLTGQNHEWKVKICRFLLCGARGPVWHGSLRPSGPGQMQRVWVELF